MATNAAAQNAIKKRLVSKLEVCESVITGNRRVKQVSWDLRMICLLPPLEWNKNFSFKIN